MICLVDCCSWYCPLVRKTYFFKLITMKYKFAYVSFFKIYQGGQIETPSGSGFGPRAVCLSILILRVKITGLTHKKKYNFLTLLTNTNVLHRPHAAWREPQTSCSEANRWWCVDTARWDTASYVDMSKWWCFDMSAPHTRSHFVSAGRERLLCCVESSGRRGLCDGDRPHLCTAGLVRENRFKSGRIKVFLIIKDRAEWGGVSFNFMYLFWFLVNQDRSTKT